MPKLSWVAAVDPRPETLVFVSDLQTPDWKSFLGLMRAVPGITRQLKRADGCHGYELRAHVRRRRLTTVSAWRDESAMKRFVRGEPHRTVMVGLAGKVGEPVFLSRTVPASEVHYDADAYLNMVAQ